MVPQRLSHGLIWLFQSQTIGIFYKVTPPPSPSLQRQSDSILLEPILQSLSALGNLEWRNHHKDQPRHLKLELRVCLLSCLPPRVHCEAVSSFVSHKYVPNKPIVNPKLFSYKSSKSDKGNHNTLVSHEKRKQTFRVTKI